MLMQQLIYASRPFGYSASTLAGILSAARTRNAQYDITGALICRPDIYLQLLEGPIGRVETLFANIQEDDRHVDVQVLVRAKVVDRLFPGWSMKHDPSVSWMWRPDEIIAGAIQKSTVFDVRSIFVRAANAGVSERF